MHAHCDATRLKIYGIQLSNYAHGYTVESKAEKLSSYFLLSPCSHNVAALQDFLRVLFRATHRTQAIRTQTSAHKSCPNHFKDKDGKILNL